MDNNFNLDSNNYFGKMTQGFMPVFPVNNTMQQFASEMRKIPNRTLTQDQFIIQNPQQKKKKKHLGRRVAYIMGLLGLGAILINKGASGKTSKWIRDFLNNREISRLADAAKNGSEKTLDKVLSRGERMARRAINFGDTAANFTAYKDTAFHEITSWRMFGLFDKFPSIKGVQTWLQKHVPIQKGFDWCSEKIFNITQRAVDNLYASARTELDQFTAVLNSSKSKLKSETAKNALDEQIRKLTESFNSSYSQTGINSRWGKTKDNLKNLAEWVREECKEGLLGLFNKDHRKHGRFMGYITKNGSAEARKELEKEILNASKGMTYNIDDIASTARNLGIDLKDALNFNDLESRKLLAQYYAKITEYAGLKGSTEAASREPIQKEILNILDKLRNNIIESSEAGTNGKRFYDSAVRGKLEGIISNMKTTFSNSGTKKGLIEEILSTAKGDLSAEEYAKLKEAAEAFRKRLSKANSHELAAFDRYGEVLVGAIPTDVMSNVVVAGGGALAIANARDKDERVGTTLKVGIPLASTVGSYFVMTAMGISGIASLGLTLAAGLMFNRVGSAVYAGYKQHSDEKKSMMQIAQNAYNNVTSV